MEIALILVVSTLLVTATVLLSFLILFDAPRERAQVGGRLISEGLLFYSFSFILVLGVTGAVSPDLFNGLSHVGLVVAVFCFPVLVLFGSGLYLITTGHVPSLNTLSFAKSRGRIFLVSFEVALILMGISVLMWRGLYFLYYGK